MPDAPIALGRRTLLASASALLALPRPGNAQISAGGNRMVIVLDYEPPTLVSLTNVATPALTVSGKVTEGLLQYSETLDPEPELAASWEIAPDGLTYTFHLRQGVRWHDGRPFTSADVAFSIELLRKVHPRGRGTFANVTAIETPDAATAVLRLSRPAPYLIKALAASESPIVPRHIYEGTDPAANPNGNAPVGTGPFRFKEWVRGSHILYERNPDYWVPGLPKLDQLVVRFIPDAASRSIAFETGAVDIGYRTPVALSDLERLRQLPSLAFEPRGNSYSFNVTRLEFNLQNAHFARPQLRQAIAHAIDRAVIARTVYYGYATICHSPIAPGLAQFHDPAPTPYPYDPRAAERLLDAAGYPRGADRVRLRLTLDYNPIGSDTRRLADYIRAALSRVGIAVEVRSQDLSSFIRRVYTDRDFDFTLNGASNLFDPTVGVQRLYWSKNRIKGVPFSNGTWYHNPRVDELLETAAVENDPARRVALFREFQQIVAAEVPDLNLVQPTFLTIHNRRVTDHSLTANGIESNLARARVV
ncbi:ABC transporter substrate-binding protein [Rhodovastum atsumiense]|uniref:ABC transporter substrate-binding protein n=1 Tax=Rhodovastum atsumiense TaxID=504468 RepID=A0A5M6IZE3_9PROT|nr:ABC transporter substrate-binding protein [Rhodovastum atsumiense]KAA5612745.1 ABC transporter substrate-binding protein [Rhodovastum atsumiense]CAH2602694.1 ABC transporter substrate-binding protein [Rhodovastum atsumiense]